MLAGEGRELALKEDHLRTIVATPADQPRDQVALGRRPEVGTGGHMELVDAFRVAVWVGDVGHGETCW